MDFTDKINMMSPEKQREILKKVEENGEKYRLYPLSSQQKRMWFLYNLNPDDLSYITRYQFRIRGIADKKRIDDVMTALIKKHRILRTIYISIDGVAFQTWVDDYAVSSELIEGKPDTDEIDRITLKPFRLEREIPIRTWMIEQENQEWLYFISMHHITHDGWSVGMLLQDFYQAYENGVESIEDGRTPSYVDYVRYQQETFNEERETEKLRFWKEYLGNRPEGIGFAKTDSSEQDQNQEVLRIEPDSELSRKLSEFAADSNSSVFNVVLGLFFHQLYGWTGEEYINIGMPVLNRKNRDFMGTAGYFSNTVAVRESRTGSFEKLLKSLTENMREVLERSDVPFNSVVNELGAAGDIDKSPVFNVMFSMQSRGLMKNSQGDSVEIDGTDFQFTPFISRFSPLDYPLTLTVVETVEGYAFGFSYSREYFKKESIEVFRDGFADLLDTLLTSSEGVDDYKFSGSFSIQKKESVSEAGIEEIYRDLTETESVVRGIWEEVIGNGDYPVNKPYFSVGGNSINCFSVLKRINSYYSIDIKIAEIFRYNTIEQMGRYLDREFLKTEEKTTVSSGLMF